MDSIIHAYTYPKIAVVVLTYNQEQFIEMTLDSILCQKTNYTYEIIIADDCSIDKTPDICRRYKEKFPDKIRLLLQNQNQGLMKNYQDAMSLVRSEYVLECAGDDYWIDPHKIELQVSFLELNKGFGLVHTAYKLFNHSKNSFSTHMLYDANGITTFEELIHENRIGAVTVCFRYNLYCEYFESISPIEKGWKMEDYPFWLWLAKYSSIMYFTDITSVYRVIDNSISNQLVMEKKIDFRIQVFKIRQFFAEQYNFTDNLKSDFANHYLNLLNVFYQHRIINSDHAYLKTGLNQYSDINFWNKLRLWGLKSKFNYWLSNFAICLLKKTFK